MVTAQPASEGSFYLPADGTFDEALEADGAPRPQAAASLELIAADPAASAARTTARCRERGVVFNSYHGDQEFLIDPVPRVISTDDFELLETGLIQRVKALDLFIDDVYGARSSLEEGVVPERVATTAEHYDPLARKHRPPGGVWIGVAGLDVVRNADGELLVLEDNLRTPSGFAYALAARELVRQQYSDAPPAQLPQPIDSGLALLERTLIQAAPEAAGDDPRIVLLSDGPHNSAWWEHTLLANRLSIALVVAADLELRDDHLYLKGDGRQIDVVYRRTDACDAGSWVGELVGGPLRAGNVGMINGFGTGVGDDKLVHAYVEDLVRFFLGEEPLIRSVKTFDLMRPEDLEAALDRLDELVVKPRGGAGGVGVIICPHARPSDIEATRAAITKDPAAYVAQELVMLSTHPTVVDGKLTPRHVDLRPFVYMGRERDAQVVPGGLTRVAFDDGALIVNSSQNGGAKDTWVMGQ